MEDLLAILHFVKIVIVVIQKLDVAGWFIFYLINE